MEDSHQLPILLFDSKCPLCVRFKDSLMRLDGAHSITPVSIYNDDIYKQYPFLDRDSCQQEVHFITKDGQVLKGNQAIEHLIKLYPLVNSFSWLIESNMGKKAINYFHQMTDTYRKNLKRKCPSCVK